MALNWKVSFARIRGVLMRRGRPSHEAEELAQEAWIRMARHGGGEPVANPEAFLMRTALNLSIDAHRSQSSRGREVALEDVVLFDHAPGVEEQLLGRERLARMMVCLERLPERTREIFLAHRLDGRSYTDIADELEISVNAVEKHVTKAMLLVTRWMEGW